MPLTIAKEFESYFTKEKFEADPKNPYKREDGKVQHRFIKKDKKGHNIAEVWLNESNGTLGAE